MLFNFDTKTYSNFTLTAKWEKIEYHEVTFDYNNSLESEVVSIKNNEKLIQPINPSKENFEFIGWFKGDSLFDFNNQVNSSFTLTAKYKSIVIEELFYDVTIVLDNGQEILVQKVKEANKINSFNDPIKVGYKTDNGIFEINTPIYSNLVVYVIWEEHIYYNVTISFDNGSEDLYYSVKKGESLNIILEDPYKDGYEFIGWFNGYSEYNFNSIIVSDTKVNAKYK